jgi:PTS system mannose-specific IIA component
MIGYVLITHGKLGGELLETLSVILPQKRKNLVSVAIDHGEDTTASTGKIKDAIKAVDSGNGVILFTDMFGGTPSNLGITFLDEDKVEIISGVNLPMLLKAAMLESYENLQGAAEAISNSGRESITMASNLLSPKSKAPQ